MKGSFLMNEQVYDVIGIGIGPFNLGLAALIEPVEEISAVFFDKEEKFEWHPGMLIDGTDLQVPFLADLVTFADPTSPYTFLNYIHKQKRMYPFFYFNRFDIPRQEYNEYAKWVEAQLKSCHFQHEVVDVKNHEYGYEVTVKQTKSNKEELFYAKHVVLGTGAVPFVPKGLKHSLGNDVVHSSSYLQHKEHLQQGHHITVVGSGQSAAEIFYDLLKNQPTYGYHLSWFTRSSNFQQLDQSKLAQELFSPDYVQHFHDLPFKERIQALEDLNPLRNGIEASTLQHIYDLMYHRSIQGEVPVTIRASIEVEGITNEGGYHLHCRQKQTNKEFAYETDRVVLATGYKPHLPKWMGKFHNEIEWEDDKRFKVMKDYRLQFKTPRDHYMFTLTNIEHSHGSSATNLGLSVQRNQCIVNTIAGKEIYPVSFNTTFQQFDLPE